MNLPHYLQKHYTPDTAKVYLFEINNYLGNCPGAFTAVYQEVEGYIGALRTRYSNPSTLNRIVCSLKAYYDSLCDSGQREDNPAQSIRLRDQRSRDIQLQDLFTMEELEALLYLRERYSSLAGRNKVLMSLLVYQALYPVEMEALQVADINLEAGTIQIKVTA